LVRQATVGMSATPSGGVWSSIGVASSSGGRESASEQALRRAHCSLAMTRRGARERGIAAVAKVSRSCVTPRKGICAMRKASWLVAAALLASSVVVAAPSSAQVQFGIGPNGPNVQIGPDDNRRHERPYMERRRYRDDDRLTTGTVGGCRTMVIREEDEDGDIVTRRVRRCR
jgi:hypothetical protein